MRNKLLFEVGLALCTVGGALFGVGVSREAVNKLVELPTSAFATMMVLGGLLAIVGGASFILSLVIDRLQEAVSQVIYGDLDSKYFCNHAKRSDLPGLRTLYQRYFGDDVPDLELMREWTSKCTSSFTIVQRVTERTGLQTRQELVGSFKLLPLTKKGTRALELGQVTGSTFNAEHIASKRSHPAGYYVGDVVATTRFARGVVMAHLNAALAPAMRENVTVFARPLTRDGLRVMTGHGFVQVCDGRSAPQIGRACKLELAGRNPRLAQRLSRRRRLGPIAERSLARSSGSAA